jgi:hypothetical protein
MSDPNASRGWTGFAQVAVIGMLFVAILGATPPPDGIPPLLLLPERIAAVLAGERLTVCVNLPPACDPPLGGTLSVALLDPEGRVLDRGLREVRLAQAAGPAFVFKAPDLGAEGVRVRCRLAGEVLTIPLPRVLLRKGHETSLSLGRELDAGSRTWLRCEVHGVRSLRETVPLAGAAVTARFRTHDGKAVAGFSARTNIDGVAEGRLEVPELPPGDATLEIVTRSALGSERLTQAVKIRAPARVLLVSDRPLYQPGQRMHLRALALRPHDLHPIAGGQLTFTIEDGRGNKVYRQSVKTSAHGVASADFNLADEVNTGDYRIRAVLGEHTAEKTVAVKPYVLPKFKVELTTDRGYYLQGESVRTDVQAGYFFGKPAAGARVKVRAGLGPKPDRPLQTWEGTADAAGHAHLEVGLPRRQGGEASLRLTADVTDTAGHTETVTRDVPVSEAALQVSLVPEGGRLVPGLENRVHVVTVRPDGSPVACSVRIGVKQGLHEKLLEEVETDSSGLASFALTPDAEMVMQQNPWEPRSIERLEGQVEEYWAPRLVVPLTVKARDGQGNRAVKATPVPCEPLGENIRLRLDRATYGAIYRAYQRPQVEVFSTAGLSLAALELVQDGQVLWHQRLQLADGYAVHRLELPADRSGAMEVHAWQLLPSGEVIRDARLIYVEPRNELQVKVRADKPEHRPGEEGRIRFEVTGAGGKPAVAALGVLVVDEAVYALQDVQPGLDKAYFTLRPDLLGPQAQAVFGSPALAEQLVRGRVDEAPERKAEVLFAGVRLPAPVRHEVDPAFKRRLQLETAIRVAGMALWLYTADGGNCLERDGKTGRWQFRPGLLEKVVKQVELGPKLLTLPLGGRLTLEEVEQLEPGFTADHLALAVTRSRMRLLAEALAAYSEMHENEWRHGHEWDDPRDRRWAFPANVLAEAVESQGEAETVLEDAWGRPIRLVKRSRPGTNRTGLSQLDHHELLSAGPDGEFGTDDDVHLPVRADDYPWWRCWWHSDAARQAWTTVIDPQRRGAPLQPAPLFPLDDEATSGWRGAGAAGFGFGGGFPAAGFPAAGGAAGFPAGGFGQLGVQGGFQGGGRHMPNQQVAARAPTAAAPPRLREYFPETMLWRPEIITDEHGVAELPVHFPDSITTWRLTASASSRDGLLGGVSVPLRVFQDFFVDIDAPAALTRGDEVAFPVAVYNYLKQPQTVQIELEPGPWFALLDSAGPRRTLDLKPNEVTAVRYRIRALNVGHFPLTVRARGTKMSDAVRRAVEVQPDGQKVEQVASGQLAGTVTQVVTIPGDAIPDASRLLVQVQPGIISQIIQGVEGLLQQPFG